MKWKTFYIPKRSGGWRRIDQPTPEHAELLRSYLPTIYSIPVSPFCHAFERGRSVFTCLQSHINKDAIIVLDVKDCFGSVKEGQLRKLFGNKEDMISNLLNDDKFLPQGSPVSPLIVNRILSPFDWTIVNVVRRAIPIDITYTRYADELIFSGDNELIIKYYRVLIGLVTYYLQKNGFKLNPKKTRVLGLNKRRIILGCSVTDKVRIPKRLRRNLRAALFQVKNGRPMSNTLRGELAWKTASEKPVDTRYKFEEVIKREDVRKALFHKA